MKNVTLAIDERLLGRARSLAAKRKTTLNAMVRSLLEGGVEQENRIAAARAGMLELMERSTLEFEPGTDLKELSRSRVRRGYWMHRRYQIRYCDGALLAAAEASPHRSSIAKISITIRSTARSGSSIHF